MGFCSSLATPVHFTLRMLFYTKELTKVLEERFDDIDEIYDIANYGCATGVSGFTYLHETTTFFHEFEDDIEDVCYDTLGEDFMEQLAKDTTSVMGLKQKMVWHTIETYCQRVMQDEEEAKYA